MEVSPTTQKAYDAMVEWLFENGLDVTEADGVVAAIRARWPNPTTQKTKLALLKGYLNRLPDFDKDVLQKYATLLDDVVKATKKDDVQEATEKEKENWLSWPQVLEFAERLKTMALAEFGNEKTYVTMLEDAILVSLYSDMAVLRNDYANVGFCNTAANWLDVRTGQLTIREHKTAKTHGPLTRQLPTTILFMIQTLLMKSPRSVLFAQNESALSARLIRLFERHTGKKIGSTLLRHIWITHLQEGEKTLKQKAAIAASMGHSTATQSAYRRPGLDGV